MTGSTHPTLTQEFAIQVAENEGMPPMPNFEGALLQVVRTRLLTGTLTLGHRRYTQACLKELEL
jgi:hypothetical protein